LIPQVDDSVVQAVRIEGNQALGDTALRAVVRLKAGTPLTRAAVLSDMSALEARYRQAGKSVQVWPELTHPGEGQGQPITTLTYRLFEGARARHYDDAADPLANYYDNTLVCAAAQTGNDLCHLWLNRDGSFINFDVGEAKSGHYQVGPRRADGKVPVCQYWDTPDMVTPAEIAPHMGPPPAAAGKAGAMVCKNHNFRTTCVRGVDPAALSAEEKALIAGSMGERFYGGMCYPIGPHDPGDIWFEQDDPLPGQLGKDKVLLLQGRQ